MVKIELPSGIFILVDNTNEQLWSIIENMMCAEAIESGGMQTSVITDENMKRSSFRQFIENCLKEFSKNFRGSVLVFEDVNTGEKPSELDSRSKLGPVPLVVDAMFNIIPEKPEEKYFLSVSYLELCKEYVRDLLDGGKKKLDLSAGDDYRAGVQNVTSQEIQSTEFVSELLTQGGKWRGLKDDNSLHTVFNISLKQQNSQDQGEQRGESHLNFLFLACCVDRAGGFGDQSKKSCPHFNKNQIIDLLDEELWDNVRSEDCILKAVLKQLVGGIRVIYTLSDGINDPLNSLRFPCIANPENELAEIPSLTSPGLQTNCEVDSSQNEQNSSDCTEEATEMYRTSVSTVGVHSKLNNLETILEEDEVEDTNSSMDGMSTTSSRRETEETVMQNGDDGHFDCSVLLKRLHDENDVCPNIESEPQEYALYYQRKYDELRDFTFHEKQIYEESFNIQLLDANTRIEELEHMNSDLERRLNEEMNKCKTEESQNGIRAEKQLATLKDELRKSECRRNECETKLELLENNFRKRNKELVESLEDAWKELSGFKDLCEHQSNGWTSSDDDDPKNGLDIRGLKDDNLYLKKKNAEYYALSQKIEEYMKIKKSLVSESTLSIKISDLEKEIASFKEMNRKLSEKLTMKDLELQEMCATYTLFKEENMLLKNENEKMSKHIEQVIEGNSLCQNLETTNRIEILSKDLEGKMEDLQCLRSENIKLKSELKALGNVVTNFHEMELEIQLLNSGKAKLMDELKVLQNRSGLLEEKEKEVQCLRSENVELKSELKALGNVVTNFQEKELEIQQLNSDKAKMKDELKELQNRSVLLEDKEKEVQYFNKENVKLKEEVERLENVATLLPKTLDEKEKEIQALQYTNTKLEEEMHRLQADSMELSNVIEKRVCEIRRLDYENCMMKEQISTLSKSENLLPKLKEKILELSEKFEISEMKLINVKKYEEENVKLKDEVADMRYKLSSFCSTIKDKTLRISELQTENVMLKEQIHTHVREIERLHEGIKEIKDQLKEYSSENVDLKEKILHLKENSEKMSEYLSENDNKIKDLIDENSMLKDEICALKIAGKRMAEDTVAKIRSLENENSSLKVNVHKLTSDLNKRDSDLKELSLKEAKKNPSDQIVQIAALKKEVALLHKENGSLSKLNKSDRRHNILVPKDCPNSTSTCDSMRQETKALSGSLSNELIIDRTALFSPLLTSTVAEGMMHHSHLTCNNINKDEALEEELKSSHLKRKVIQQRKLLNIAQKRELQMRTKLEMCQNQLNSIQNLKDDNEHHNKRIMQLELQAQHDEYIHRTRTSCLEAFVNGLRNENIALKSQLNHVNCKVKKLFFSVKSIRQNNKSSLKQAAEAAVQTVRSSSDNSYLSDFKLKSDICITQDYDSDSHMNTPTRDTDELCTAEDQFLKSPLTDQPTYDVLRINSKQSLDIRIQKKIHPPSPSPKEKKVPKVSGKSPYHRYLPPPGNVYNFCNYAPKNINFDGAEGWARLGREFDALQNSNNS